MRTSSCSIIRVLIYMISITKWYIKYIDGLEVRGCDTPGRFATAGLTDILTEPVILKETKRR